MSEDFERDAWLHGRIDPVWHVEEPEHEPWGITAQIGYVVVLCAVSLLSLVLWRKK